MTDFLISMACIAGYGFIGGAAFAIVMWLSHIIFREEHVVHTSSWWQHQANGEDEQEGDTLIETHLSVDDDLILMLCWAAAAFWPMVLPGFVGYYMVARRGKVPA